MEQKLTRAQMFRHAFRPRVLLYSAILLGIVVAAGVSLWLRVPLKVDVIRDRAAIAREVEGGAIENVYRLQLINTEEEERYYYVSVGGLPGIHLATRGDFLVDGASSRMVTVRVRVGPGAVPAGTHPIQFQVSAAGIAGVEVHEKSVFIVR
jgi:polyferredoxin